MYKEKVSNYTWVLRILAFYYKLMPYSHHTPSKEVAIKIIKENFKEYKHIKRKKDVINTFLKDNWIHIFAVKKIIKEENLKQQERKIQSSNFYNSNEWRKIRYEVLREQGGKCQCCGRSAKDGVVLHVDHIIPLSKDWNKRLDKDNLQVLCEDCNIGKSNTDSIDWRK